MPVLRSLTRPLRIAALTSVVLALVVVPAPWARAATFTVTNTNDSGPGSLRQALLDANATVGADTINFAVGVTGTITLTSGQLTVTDNLTIDGPGASNLTISGNNSSRVLELAGGATLDLKDVTVANGSEFQGGGILNSGTLLLTGMTITNNVGELSGGGIWNTGTAMLTDSTVSGNTAPGPPDTVGVAGGIWNGGAVTLVDSSLSGNSAGQAGGFANTGTLTVTGSTIDGNTASSSSGGGDNYGGTVTLANATVSSNAGWAAGGLRNFGGTITVANATFSDNTGIGFTGFATGAIKNEPGYGGVVNVGGSILANSPTFGDCLGTITSQGYNLIEDTSSCTIEGDTTGNLTGVDPVLGPLDANGGPTKTHALLEGSPALDAGSPACPPPATDQRGVSRPQGAACDIGAFELVTTVTVGIDIKPGGFPNSINTSKKGVIPVAVIGTPTLDASTVDPSTVCFGDTEDATQRDCSVAPGTVLRDVNGDGILDLVLHFDTLETGIDPGDTQACLTGELFDGTSIAGCDSVRTK